MADETSKQMVRRSADRRFITRWIVGDGIDIGCGPDPLSKFADFVPLMKSLRPWDLPDGDAMLMDGIADESYDFVHSSHCLEHLVDPVRALGNWIRICRKGGHLIVTIPDEDMYEQGVWPSTFNEDHKWTFTILKSDSWSPKSINVLELLAIFRDEIEILKIEKLDASFHYGRPRFDQTMHTMSESGIEFVLRRRGEPASSPAKAQEDIDALVSIVTEKLREGNAVEAKEQALRIIGIAPQDTRAVLALCDAYEALEEFDEEARLLEEKQALFVDRAGVCVRQGKCFENLNRTDDALRCFERALQWAPEHAEAHVYAGRQYMKQGDFAQGTRELAWMWHGRHPELTRQVGMFSGASGERPDLAGMTTLLVHDSGLGDTIQFVRYARLLKEMGAHVVVQCPNELARLIRNMVGVDSVCTNDSPFSGAALMVPMHNLMGAFDTRADTIPGQTPYLRAYEDEQVRWQDRLSEYPGLRVGLCWSGNPLHPRNKSRSVPYALIEQLLGLDGVTFFSLQKDMETAAPGIVDWSAEFADMAATAGLVQNLDLVISVDSVVAHLAGALGRPVWLLNRFDTCWRWLEEGAESRWYPTMTVFRQQSPGSWSDVIDEVKQSLIRFPRIR